MKAIKLLKRYNHDWQLEELADQLKEFMKTSILSRVSSRGFCYLMEIARVINKDEIDKMDAKISDLVKKGYLPVDFVSKDVSRVFYGVKDFEGWSPEEVFQDALKEALNDVHDLLPNYWEDEEYYIQMVVEKTDLVELFKPICNQYRIPIANSKGWSSVLQRAEYTRRFKEAEERGLKCVLLYCGDFDPGGIQISDTLRKNLKDIENIHWMDGEIGYNPDDLIIERFGLNYDFIIKHNLVWIDNLITSSEGYIAEEVNGEIIQGKTKQGKPHPQFFHPQVQDYLRKYRVRKVEANVLIVVPEAAYEICENAIQSFLGVDALERFEEKRKRSDEEYKNFLIKTGKHDTIKKWREE